MSSLASDHLYGTPRVGGDTLAWCTKCKMELAHVIVSMTGVRPAKVICKTCKSQHNFKRGVGANDLVRASTSKRPRKTAAPEKSYVKVSEMWEQKMAAAKGEPVPYAVSGTFEKGQVLSHPSFGMGIVEEVKGNKISVMFRNEEKTLVHGMVKPS